MRLPLNLWDISFWLAIAAILMIFASEFLSPHYSKTKVQVDRKRLRNLAIIVSILFLATFILRIVYIILGW